MTDLNLANNRLSSLKTGLNSLTGLSNIDLSRNQIRSVSSSFFEYNTYLFSIDLSENQISSLPSDIFKRNTKLQDINLSNNVLGIVLEKVIQII